MSSVFKRTWRDDHGNLVVSKKQTVEFRDAKGKWRQIPGFTDEKASKELGRKLERLGQLRSVGEHDASLSKWAEGLPDKLREKLARWGILDRVGVASGKPLTKHLDDYRQALLDGVASPKQKGPATQKHADLSKYRVTTLLGGIGANTLSDVNVESVGRYLAQRRLKGLSVASSNHYVKDGKAFFNWLVRAGRASSNPIAGIAKLQITANARKHIRRALEADEAANLLRVTSEGPEHYGMSGLDRYWLYRLALETAFRSSELRALTRANFRLDDAEPTVWLPGDSTKNRESAELPLRPATVEGLRAYLAGKHPKTALFTNMPIVTDVAYMLRFDLKAAGIAYETESGKVDFHALRGTCLSWLAAANVPVKTLQTFARHSDPRLTMNLYARTLRGTMADAAGRLPELSQPLVKALQATGTNNHPPNEKHTAGRTALSAAGNADRKRSPQFAAVRGCNELSQRIRHAQNPAKQGASSRSTMHPKEREWMGIEPTRSRASDPSTALKAAGPTRRPDTPIRKAITQKAKSRKA